jgi:hypothetical protein
MFENLERRNMKRNKKYNFHSSEPSILVELFLPKRIDYQATLYSTLKGGLMLHDRSAGKEGYASHFMGENQNNIKRMLKEDYGIEGNYEKFVSRNRRLFTGYSTYDVMGTFSSEKRTKNKELIIFDEATTVIKIIFKPNYAEFKNEMKNICHKKNITDDFIANLTRIVLRTSYRKNEVNSLHHYAPLVNDSCYKNLTDNELQNCVKVIKHWIDDVGFFLFGYIVFQLSEGVNQIEQEIWVTSHWNFNVNRITLENDEENVMN